MISALFLMAASLQPDAPTALPGVSDVETSIPYAAHGGIREYHRGQGDVLFVRDRRNQWFRVQLNSGCLSAPTVSNTLRFATDSDRRLDRNDRVLIGRSRTCLVDSVRASLAPPQVDSDSIVTLR